MAQKVASALLQEIVKIIVKVAQPERVILFGSRARGTAREESDYDFLVVMPEVQNGREISRRIYRALLEHNVAVPVDVIVVSADMLQKHRDNPFYIYRQALQEGKVLHDQRRGRKLATAS